MTWLLVMVLQISVAMAVGFVLGRIWQIRCDLEEERAGDFAAARRPHFAPHILGYFMQRFFRWWRDLFPRQTQPPHRDDGRWKWRG